MEIKKGEYFTIVRGPLIKKIVRSYNPFGGMDLTPSNDDELEEDKTLKHVIFRAVSAPCVEPDGKHFLIAAMTVWTNFVNTEGRVAHFSTQDFQIWPLTEEYVKPFLEDASARKIAAANAVPNQYPYFFKAQVT